MKKRWWLLLLSGVVLLSTVLYAIFTPHVAVWVLRKNFGGDPELINVSHYDMIKDNVRIYKNLTYPSEHQKNNYDIYLPKNTSERLPTIIWVHGGAFVAGSKDGIENYAIMLANEGYAVVAVDYEWAPEIKYPGQVMQVEECIRELYRIKDEYQLDMEQIVLFGDSAGAHIAAQVALLATNERYQAELNLASNLEGRQLKGLFLYCGPYNVEKMLHTGNAQLDFFSARIGWALFGEQDWKNSSLLKTTAIKDYVTNGFPPTFITDGNTGSFERQGKELAEAITAQGVMVHTLFFDKDRYGDIPHEYQFNIGDNGAGSLSYQETLSFLKMLGKPSE